MNLPFLRKNNISGAIMTTKVRAPDAPESEEDQGNQGLQAAARDLITAIQSGDEKAVAQALHAAYELCESQPSAEPSDLGDELSE